MLALPIILFLTVLAWDIVTDYKKWLNNRAIPHTKEAWLRCALLIPATIGFTILHPAKDWSSLVYTLTMEFFVFWTLFDGLYGVLRREGFWYTGGGGEGSAGTDNFLKSIPLWLHIAIKIGGCAGGIYLYFK